MAWFAMQVEESATRMVISDPVSFAAVAVGLLVTYVLFVSRRKNRLWRTRNVVHLVIALVVWWFCVSWSQVMLDREAGVATLTRVHLFVPVRRTIPLGDIMNARVAGGPGRSAVQLQLANGHVYWVTEASQEGGKDEAAFAINRFVGASAAR